MSSSPDKHSGFFGFDLKHLKGDLFGGITAGVVALPLALAFGLQSGLGPEAGLYGAIFISFFAALFGGTNTQISGPTAPMTAVSMIVIAGIVTANDGDIDEALPAILMVFLLAGLIQIGFGWLRVGQYIRYVPYPVVSGFMSGIGVIILVTQALPLMGYYPKEDVAYVQEYKSEAEEVILVKILQEEAAEDILVLENFDETIKRAQKISDKTIDQGAVVLAAENASGVIGALRMTGRAIQQIILQDFFIGLITITIIYTFKRITRAIPSTLVALLTVTIGTYFIIGEGNYRTIGTIPSGFPALYWTMFTNVNFAQVLPYLMTALSLAILGSIDSLLTSIVADNMTKTKHQPNQELVGQGIGNTIAAMFGGIPGAGATIRTVVNIKSGGRTKLSGMIAGLLLLFILLALGPLASKIPAAVLAGILVTVGIGVMDYKGLRKIHQLPLTEVIVMLTVLIMTVTVGLIEAVIVGIVLSCVLFMKHLSDVVEQRTPPAAPLKEFVHEMPWLDEGDLITEYENRVFVKHLDGPLFFGFSSRFQEIIAALPEMEVFIIRMDRVPYIDQSGLFSLEDAIMNLQSRGIQVVFTDVHGQPRDLLEKLNLIPDLVGQEFCFDNFDQCSSWLKVYLKNP